MVEKEMAFFLDRRPLIEDLREDVIEDVMQQVLLNGRAVPTANAYRGKYIALANFAFKCGILKTVADVPKLSEIERVPIGWAEDQLRTLFHAAQNESGFIDGIPTAGWLTALLAVLLDSAERIGAILQTRWNCLDWVGRRLVVPGEFRKHKRTDKDCGLHPHTMEFLRRIELPRRELIFPWPLSRERLTVRDRSFLKRAGLPHGRKYMFHALRKTSASMFKAKGGDPVALLGHMDPNVTRVYMVPGIIKAAHPADLVPRPYDPRVMRLTDGREDKAS